MFIDWLKAGLVSLLALPPASTHDTDLPSDTGDSGRYGDTSDTGWSDTSGASDSSSADTSDSWWNDTADSGGGVISSPSCGDGLLFDGAYMSGLLDGTLDQSDHLVLVSLLNDGEGGLSGSWDAGQELCEDGNTTDGDGCSAMCGIEPEYVCVDQRLTPLQLDSIPSSSPSFPSAAVLSDLTLSDAGETFAQAGDTSASIALTGLPDTLQTWSFTLTPSGSGGHIGFALGYGSDALTDSDGHYMLLVWGGTAVADAASTRFRESTGTTGRRGREGSAAGRAALRTGLGAADRHLHRHQLTGGLALEGLFDGLGPFAQLPTKLLYQLAHARHSVSHMIIVGDACRVRQSDCSSAPGARSTRAS